MDCTRLLVFVAILQFCAICSLLYYYAWRHNTISNDNEAKYTVKALRVQTFSLHGTLRPAPPTPTVHTRGKISGCTLNDTKSKPGVVLLLCTNTAYIDMTLNLLESIKRTGVCLNTTIMAMEKKAYQVLLIATRGDPAITVLKSPQGDTSEKKLLVFSPEYNILVNRRHRYILSLLQQGFEVLSSDVDTFWFRDPFSYFRGNFDMSFVDEVSPYPTRLQDKSLHCAGLGYFKPTNKTIMFVQRWVDILAHKHKGSDQAILNRMMHNNEPVRVEVSPLPLKHFPHGNIFWNSTWRKENNDPIIMHNVGFKMRGHDAKVEKFKENNMWLVNVMINEGWSSSGKRRSASPMNPLV